MLPQAMLKKLGSGRLPQVSWCVSFLVIRVGWRGIEFSPDGQLLLTGSGDRTARLWDVATGQTIRVFGDATAVLQDVAFSPDGRLAVTAGDDKIAKVWSLQTFPGGMEFNHGSGRSEGFILAGWQMIDYCK